MARLIDQIAEQKPAVIVVDILYTERTNSETVVTKERFEQIQPFLYQGSSVLLFSVSLLTVFS